MRLLELFSGSGSIGKEFNGEVVSVDIEGNPTHKVDIFDWDYTVYPQKYFDIVWASPPCVQYSRARTKAKIPRDLEGADRLVQRALNLIDYFAPTFWFVENPWTSLLRKRDVISHLPPPKKVSYCKYGYPYQKNTAIWTNAEIELEYCKKDCDAMIGNRHGCTAQRGGDKFSVGFPQCVLYTIPPRLCREICSVVNG